MTSVVIPAGVRSIGCRAFYSASSSEPTIVTSFIPAEDLFEIPTDIIRMTNAGKKRGIYKFYVPFGAKDTYASTAGWNQFCEIIEMESTGIDEVFDEVKAVYDLQGRRVLEPKKGGIYIINNQKVIF